MQLLVPRATRRRTLREALLERNGAGVAAYAELDHRASGGVLSRRGLEAADRIGTRGGCRWCKPAQR